jgi:hypothetical protein
MEESNGTNLKLILPIHFFKQIYEISGVLELRPDRGLDRSRSTRTPPGRKVLTWLSQKKKKNMGDGEKLLTYLNSALKVLIGTDIFLHLPKKS